MGPALVLWCVYYDSFGFALRKTIQDVRCFRHRLVRSPIGPHGEASLAVERNDDGGLPRQPGGRQAGSARKQPPEIEGPVPKDLRDADLVEDESLY